MLVWGSNSKVINGSQVDGIECPSCGATQFNAFGLLKYFHLYRIPTIPLSKQVGIECTHCKKTMIGDEVPSNVVSELKGQIFTNQKVLPMFTGLALAVVLAIALMIAVQQNNAEEAEFIATPQVNDYYIVDIKDIFGEDSADYRYGLLRIHQINGDMIEFDIGDTVYSKSKGVRKDLRSGAAREDDYYGARVEFSKAELMQWHESGDISSIERY